MPLPTKAEAQAYIDAQGLQDMLTMVFNQVIQEMPEDGASRMAELLQTAARERSATERMRSLFAQADTNGNGFIDLAELSKFHELIGEPLDAEGNATAFVEMGGNDQSGIMQFPHDDNKRFWSSGGTWVCGDEGGGSC